MGPGKFWVAKTPRIGLCGCTVEQVWMVKTCENLGVFMGFQLNILNALGNPHVFFQLGSSFGFRFQLGPLVASAASVDQCFAQKVVV